MESIQRQVVTVALKKMFTSSSFSICAIDNCLKLSGIIADKKTYDTMRPLHCIDYKDMPEEVRSWLLDSVKLMFEYDNSFDLSFFEYRPSKVLSIVAETVEHEIIEGPKKLSFVQRLLK